VEYVIAHSGDSPCSERCHFQQIRNVEFLSAIWVDGRKSEMQILPSKAEQNAAKAAAAEKHSLSAKSASQPYNGAGLAGRFQQTKGEIMKVQNTVFVSIAMFFVLRLRHSPSR